MTRPKRRAPLVGALIAAVVASALLLALSPALTGTAPSAGRGSDGGGQRAESRPERNGESDGAPALSLGGEPIDETALIREIRAQQGAASAHFLKTSGVDPAKNGWRVLDTGDDPAGWIAQEAVSSLARRKAALSIAQDAGLMDDASLAGTAARMDARNRELAEARGRGEVAVGKTSYDIDSWIPYELAAIEAAYEQDPSNPGMDPTDREIEAYWEAHDWTVEGHEGKAPLSSVRANVRAALLRERYRDLVDARTQSLLDAANIPWDALADFARAQLAG